MTAEIAVIGAGLCGNLLAILLARQGLKVTVFDRGPPPDAPEPAAGRSINLALAARGIRALEQAGVFTDIEPLLLPMAGRIVHEPGGDVRFLPYGQRRNERIWSVSRSALNRCLWEIARDRFAVDYRFTHDCIHFDAASLTATLRSDDGELAVRAGLLLAADGAGSTIRRSLEQGGRLSASEELLDHGYKELLIPADAAGEFALDPGGLHIWPRGGFMLIALPNLDRSFTATLFLAHRGQAGFESVTTDQVIGFFRDNFNDALPLLPQLQQEFAARPTGTLGTVHCEPWGHRPEPDDGRRALLIGDAAHAIVPFHGQGMNAAFEDCAEFDRLIATQGPDWNAVVPQFEAVRRDNTRAIARMALENYAEMRDTVRDPAFERRAELAFELERLFPGRFIPRYSMVMFHPEIGYAEAERRGHIQAGILAEALAAGEPAAALRLAAQLVATRLPA
jgi:kynurenine 3-monooxygenase